MPEYSAKPKKSKATLKAQRKARQGTLFIVFVIGAALVVAVRINQMMGAAEEEGAATEEVQGGSKKKTDKPANCIDKCGDGLCGRPAGSPKCTGEECPCPEDRKKCAVDCEITSNRLDGCLNMCGDGDCTLETCIRVGCACAETAKSCPRDCR